MGLVLATARRPWQTNNDANNNTNSPSALFADHLIGLNTSSTEVTNTQANSRLNLINQLVAGSNSSSSSNRKSKSSAAGGSNLSDFQNIAFSANFFLAGRKFKNLINQAQTFLFGDQLDLAFVLSHKPVVFPYETASLDTPSNYLQSLVNIRKDTLRLVKCVENNFYESAPALNSANCDNSHNTLVQHQHCKYNIEFVFDCDCDVQIRIHYFANEKFNESTKSNQTSSSSGGRPLNYTCNCARLTQTTLSKVEPSSKCICLNSDEHPVIYKKGANILFRQPKHFFIPSKYPTSAWQFNVHNNFYPLVIECIPVDEELRNTHAHVTLAYLEKSQTILNPPQPPIESGSNGSNSSGSPPTPATNGQSHNLSAKALSVGCITQISYVYQIKAIKQKQLINGVLFSLQEIYGIEKKCSDESKTSYESTVPPTPLPRSQPATTESLGDDDLHDEELRRNELLFRNKKMDMSSLSNHCMSIETTNMSQETITTTSSSTTNLNEEEEERQCGGGSPLPMNSSCGDKEQELKGIECVICMCESRDTLILPCRHLCLCKMCAINLRVQSSNCPICRIPFIALVQIKLFKKKNAKAPVKMITELPKVKLESLNNMIGDNEEDNQIVNKQTIDENVIIQVNNRIVADGQNDRQVVTQCENAAAGRTSKKLSDYYDCVSIYDAFNYKEMVENTNRLSEMVSKKVDLAAIVPRKKRTKKSTSHKEPSERDEQRNNKELKSFNELKQKIEQFKQSQPDKEVRSCSMIVGVYPNNKSGPLNYTLNSSGSGQRAVSKRVVTLNTSANGPPSAPPPSSTLEAACNMVSRSFDDIRRSEDISLQKFNDSGPVKQSNNKISCSRF